MTKGLVRYQHCGCFHFITFSCYQRQPLLNNPAAYALFELELEAARMRHAFVLAGYVLMPEHVHLLLSEPRNASLAVALQVLKQRTSRRLKPSGAVQFWQHRYYDFNVWSEEKNREKLHYMHYNPVHRALVVDPEDWPWSSFVHYATGQSGVVEIESEWTAQIRESARRQALCNPPFAQTAQDGAPRSSSQGNTSKTPGNLNFG